MFNVVDRLAQFRASSTLPAIAMLGAPAFLALAMADAGPVPGFVGVLSENFFDSPLGFYFFSTFTYALAMTGVGDRAAIERAFFAQAKLLLALCLVLVVSFPYAFALAESSDLERYIGPWALFGICAVVAATVHRRALRSGVPARFEIPAHLVVFTASTLFFTRETFPAFEAWAGSYLLGQLPRLVALVPFVAIVAAWAPAGTIKRSALIVVLAIIPIYLGKAGFDLVLHRPTPLLWPVRVVVDFVPADVRSASFKALRTGVRPGDVVRVGAHWYRFERFTGFGGVRPNMEGMPDRLLSLYLYFPKDEFGFPARYDRNAIHIEAGSQNPVVASNVGVQYEDLTVEVTKDNQPGWPSDEKIRDVLLAFITAARMPDPPPAESGMAP